MEVLASLYGCKENELEKRIGAMTPDELGTFMFDCALVANVQSDYVHNTPDALLAAAKHYKIDATAVRKETAARPRSSKESHEEAAA